VIVDSAAGCIRIFKEDNNGNRAGRVMNAPRSRDWNCLC
jgi:hypothetical protein